MRQVISSSGLSLLLVIKLIRRIYIYTHTKSVRNTIAKKGLKIACVMSICLWYYEGSISGVMSVLLDLEQVHFHPSLLRMRSARSWKTMPRQPLKLFCRLAVLMAEKNPQLSQRQLARDTRLNISTINRLFTNNFSSVDVGTAEIIVQLLWLRSWRFIPSKKTRRYPGKKVTNAF